MYSPGSTGSFFSIFWSTLFVTKFFMINYYSYIISIDILLINIIRDQLIGLINFLFCFMRTIEFLFIQYCSEIENQKRINLYTFVNAVSHRNWKKKIFAPFCSVSETTSFSDISFSFLPLLLLFFIPVKTRKKKKIMEKWKTENHCKDQILYSHFKRWIYF